MKRVVFVALGWLSLLNMTYADSLSVSIGITCDSKSGRALVRFGYADDDAKPQFSTIDKSLDDGLSLLPVNDTNEEKDVLNCSFSSGRVVKAQLKEVPEQAAHGATQYQLSVWVDAIQIIHAQNVEHWDEIYPFGVIVNKDSYKQCHFQLAKGQWVYALTSAAPPKVPVPVICDKEIELTNKK